MATLNLKSLQAGLNSNNSTITSEEQNIETSENSISSNENIFTISEETTPQEINKVEEPAKSGFSFNLSDFTGTQETISEETIPQEVNKVEEKSLEIITPIIQEDIASSSIFSNQTTITHQEVQPINVSIGKNLSDSDDEIIEEDIDSISIQELESESQSLDLENKKTEEIEENKEYFSSFNILDEFSLEDEIIITKKEEIPEEIVTQKNEELLKIDTIIPVLNEQKDSIEKLRQEKIIPDTIEILEEKNTTLQEEQISQITSDTIENNSQTVDNIQNTTNIQNNVTQIKNQLSSTRKPSGLNIFKKKSVLAGLGIFIFGGIALGFSGMGEGNHGKSNISEINGKIPNGINHNIKPFIGTDETNISPIEGVDYKVIKNKKKNIKRMKTNSGIIDNNQNNNSQSGIISTEINGENQILKDINNETNTGDTNTGIIIQ